eukprot:211578-Lingulodinium_polyedra.AAC.1
MERGSQSAGSREAESDLQSGLLSGLCWFSCRLSSSLSSSRLVRSDSAASLLNCFHRVLR